MIKINNLNKYFNKGKRNEIHVINNTNLELPDNGLVCLLGESGCGKTTLLNVIGGLDNVKKGSIYINNQKMTSGSIHKIDKLRNLHVGYIFQDYKLMDDLSVFDNVSMALKLIGIKNKEEIKVRVEYVLDKVGILRYRYRPAGTLSGGERQRVGIARALVKNPDIILADEPTGNLDSKNSIEIMKIIKKISEDRLVILVTHERPLAKFYASRIIEIKDGSIVDDYINDNKDSLDYELENTFYLRDFNSIESIKQSDNEINIFSNDNEKVKVNLIIKNGNIYIQTMDKKRVEVIDDSSSIEVIDAHKEHVNNEDATNYDFDMSSIGNQNLKKRYSSVFKPFSSIGVGFKKVFSFSVLKKLLLIGFVFAGIFMVYAAGRISATLKVEDKDFVNFNQNYVAIQQMGMTMTEYNEILSDENIKYVIPGNSKVSFRIDIGDYYQTLNMMETFRGSLSSISLITETDITYGKLPENSKEVVIDQIIADSLITSQDFIMSGITDNSKLIGRDLALATTEEFGHYTISGIVNLNSPSIYVDDSEFLTILQYTYDNTDYYYGGYVSSDKEDSYTRYCFYQDKLSLTKNSRLPENDYEVLLPESYSYEYKLGKETSFKVNDKKLTVVGFYNNSDINKVFVSDNTIRIKMLKEASEFTVCSLDKGLTVNNLAEKGYASYDTYQRDKEIYEEGRSRIVRDTILLGAIFIAISLVEIFLMMRSSFLSRIKEIGTLRAIGVKKFDIYKMFFGEIFAITTLTSLPAILIMYRAESFLVEKISYFSSTFYMPIPLLISVILFAYIFNVLIGLIPVFKTMLKRPAKILSRYDVD